VHSKKYEIRVNRKGQLAMNKINLASVRRNFAQSVFTHQVQEAAANRKIVSANKYKKLNVGFISVVLVLLVIQSFIPDNLIFTYISAGMTVCEIVFQVVQLTFNVEQEAASHKSAALKYMSLRGKYLSLITDILSDSVSLKVVQAKRDALQDEYQTVSDLSPQTTEEDYVVAQSRLGLTGGSEEQYTWSDEEIDRFLPKTLRSH
jgi:hypothetical protein